LLEAMQDGVVFVDAEARIFKWSKGAERLTGVSSEAAEGRRFAPSLLDMCNGAGKRVGDEACPVTRALETSLQLRQRLQILGRQGRHIAIDLHAIPVHGSNGQIQGVTVLLHDAQPQATLEEKCEALHAEVTKDPMTKVANRAEFDRMLALFIEAHEQANLACSLVMIDIDHFKHINDTFGHQAGDEAIITVANLLKTMCRSGDLVARYGGEEFALLCAGCDRDDAARRAEQIRRSLAETPHHCLGDKRITASFGVAELQPDDAPETMLRRADSALLKAKEQGRNKVVQADNRMHQEPRKKKWWGLNALRTPPLLEATLNTEVPIDVAIAKLRGFVSDQNARVLASGENRIELEITTEAMGSSRRRSDRPIAFRVEVGFVESRLKRSNALGTARGEYVSTTAQISIRPKRKRSRRAGDCTEQAQRVLQRLKAYLMAAEVGEESDKTLETATV
ncbi:MAG: diguanylate cyclase, partial [Planctomycetota bacterium]